MSKKRRIQSYLLMQEITALDIKKSIAITDEDLKR
jgi:hypothetical protein